jgi:hypothetical protein
MSVSIAVASLEAVSMVAVWRSAKKAQLVNDEEASHIDMSQSLPFVTPMRLVTSTDAPMRRAAR